MDGLGSRLARLACVVGAVATALLPASTPAQARCEWQAMREPQASGPVALVITGLCTMPSPGFTIVLKRMTMPGTDPSRLLLHKEVTAPSGMVAQVLTSTPVRYREVVGETFTQVMILPDHTTIQVQDGK